MQRTRRSVLGALALLLALASCGDAPPQKVVADRAKLPLLELVADEPQFTPEQVRYLEAVARREAETRSFLAGVQQLVASTPPQLWRIMWCESGRPYGLAAYTPNWHIENLHGKSTSSGGAQFLDGTWRAWRPPGAEQWPRAMHAPWFVQLDAANRLYAAEGTRPWLASAGCWR